MRGPLLGLFCVALSLAWLILFGAGTRMADWNATMLFLGATALFYWTYRSGQTPPRLPLWHTLSLWALPVYALFQLVPLPVVLIEVLSPARALMTQSVGAVIPNITRAPISVAPNAAVLGLFSLLAYLATYGLLRDMAWRFVETNAWIPVAPIVGVAGLEAFIALGQWASGLPVSVAGTGTFASRQHFAGLLEIALPFTLTFGFISLRRHQTQESPSVVPASLAAAAWGTSLLFLLALRRSGSHASRTIVCTSLFLLIVLAVVPRLKTIALRRYGAGIAAAVGIGFVLLVTPPGDFERSLATLGSSKAATRLTVWSNSANVAADFRWFGTGMGGFETTYPRYEGSASLSNVESPENDVLALLISFGVVGVVIVLAALGGVLKPALLGAVHLSDEPRRLLAAAVVAALSAALLRCGLDSCLSIPAAAITFAWLAGISQSCGLD